MEGRWEKMVSFIPGEKTPKEIEEHYEALLHDFALIESGKIPLPNYQDDLPTPEKQKLPEVPSPRTKKGTPWTEDEHKLFLQGLERYGKGDWRSISRYLVVTRTPTQVASHAQKYFLRQKAEKKVRKRTSIHDITLDDNELVTHSLTNPHPHPHLIGQQNWVPPPDVPMQQQAMPMQQLHPPNNMREPYQDEFGTIDFN